MSGSMGKPTICIGKNKGADQLRSNCEADQRLCFRYTDSTLQPGLCRIWLEPILLVFSCTGSHVFKILVSYQQLLSYEDNFIMI